MTEHLDTLLSMAKEAHGPDITPCAGKSWEECITETKKNILFWYNDSAGSTGIIALDKETKEIEKFNKKGGL
jgi:hypothetical protein